ncbi:MAG: QueT transporter family protein [Coriobacteriia bacterium]|nr:QueT transporter family protein [Coriobacteriia bacterium]
MSYPSDRALSVRTASIAQAGIIAAIYASLTLITLTLLGGLAFGPIQLRISEAVCVLALFTRNAIPGLTIGCVLANLIGIALFGSGVLGLLDVVGGSTATLLGAWWCWRMRHNVGIALLGPVVANALIVSAYLPLILAALGFYTIPFLEISLVESYPLMYLFGVVAIGLGQALVVYGLGLPLQAALRKTALFGQ